MPILAVYDVTEIFRQIVETQGVQISQETKKVARAKTQLPRYCLLERPKGFVISSNTYTKYISAKTIGIEKFYRMITAQVEVNIQLLHIFLEITSSKYKVKPIIPIIFIILGLKCFLLYEICTMSFSKQAIHQLYKLII